MFWKTFQAQKNAKDLAMWRTLLTLDALPALLALCGVVALHPVVVHGLVGLFRFHIGGDAVGGCPSRASLVHGVLAEGAGQALLPKTHQHVEAQIAVGGFVEVFQAPHVDSVILDILPPKKKSNSKLE